MQVRNLCFMVSKREKIRRSLYAMKEEIFNHQVKLVDQLGENAAVGTRYWNFITSAHKQPQIIYDQYDSIIHTARVHDAEAEKEAQEQSEQLASSSRLGPKVRKHGNRDGRRAVRAKRVLLSTNAGHRLRHEKNSDSDGHIETDAIKRELDFPNSYLDESASATKNNDSSSVAVSPATSVSLGDAAKSFSDIADNSAIISVPSLRHSKRHKDERGINVESCVDTDSDNVVQSKTLASSNPVMSHSGTDKTQGKSYSPYRKRNHHPKRLMTRYAINNGEKRNSLLHDKCHSSPERARSCNVSESSNVEYRASPSEDETTSECQLNDADLTKVPLSLKDGHLEDCTLQPDLAPEVNSNDKEKNAFLNTEKLSLSPLLHRESPVMPQVHVEDDVTTDFSSHSPKKKLLRSKSNGLLNKDSDKLTVKDSLFSVERVKSECIETSNCATELSGNGTSLPQVEVSVDNNTGRIMLRVRNNTTLKDEIKESVEDEKEFEKTYSKSFGERKKSARIIQKHSLDSTLVDSRPNKLTPRRINGLVSASDVIVAPHIKDKVYSKLRCNKNYSRNAKKLDSSIVEKNTKSMVHEKSGSSDITNARTGTCILTKENNPANGITRLHPAEKDLVSSPKLGQRNKSRLSLSRSKHRLLKQPVENRAHEIHRKRRKIESDLELSSQDGEFADIDRDVSLKSSRDTTPDNEHLHNTRNRCNNVLVNGLSSDRFISRGFSHRSSLNKTDSESERTLTSALDSDSDYAPSDISDFNDPQRKRRYSKIWDSHDDTSRDSTPSVRSSSRLSQNIWPKFGSV